MRPFDQLTHLGRLRRYRGFAREALARYPFRDPELTLVGHDENVTYRVDAGGERFLLRIHRPGNRTIAEIRSEHEWLRALSQGSGLAVREPVPGEDGACVHEIEVEGVGVRVFDVLRWVRGRFHHEWRSLGPLRRAGSALARLHRWGRKFEPSPEFDRPRWSPERLCDGDRTYASWDEIDADHRPVFLRVRDRLMEELPPLFTPEAVCLIHGDFHHGNVLFRSDGVGIIDFDDFGWGHPTYDMASFLLWFRLRGRGEEAARHLIRGYRSVAEPSGSLEAELELFRVARMLSMLLWRAGRPEHPSYERWMSLVPRAAGRMERWLDGKDPFRVE